MREYDVAFHIAGPTLYDRYMKDIEDCVKGHYVWIHEEGEVWIINWGEPERAPHRWYIWALAIILCVW